MSFYISAQIGYYEGDKISHLDIEVPQRPSAEYVYADSEWVINPMYVAATRITRAQGKKQLIGSGIYAAVKQFVDAPDTPELVRIGFYDEEFWVITDEFITLACSSLGITPEQLQQMFNSASKL